MSKTLLGLFLIAVITAAAVTAALPALANNPDDYGPTGNPCYLQGRSYAAPYAGLTSYSWSSTGCEYSPWGARLEAYFWDGGWWGIIVTDPTFAYYSRTLYSAAVEGWHQNNFIISPYTRTGYTYAQ
jgi:hypothetical protein